MSPSTQSRRQSVSRRVAVLSMLTACMLCATGGFALSDTPGDSLATLSPPDTAAVPVRFNVVGKERFLRNHAFSLDHYLETQVGMMLVRGGPIGVDAAVSRYGFGRGRALVLLDGVPFNDPQDGLAPLAHIPTSGIGRLEFDPAGLGYAAGVEGLIAITRPDTPLGRPTTFFELSKGTNDLRQRRVRYSSIEGPIGVDVAYDEILNDGFRAPFGSGLTVPLAANDRHVSLNLRGQLEGGERYAFSLRRFEGSQRRSGLFKDINRRNGQIAALNGSVGDVDVTLYGRNHELFTPDSSTTNHTNGAIARWKVPDIGGVDLTGVVTAEDIDSRQSYGAVSGRRRVATIVGEIAARKQFGQDTRAIARMSGGGYTRHARGWGLGLDVNRRIGAHAIGAGVRRRFRPPTIGELFAPAHTEGGLTLKGNEFLDAEVSWETQARVRLSAGPLVNEVRAMAISVENPIGFWRPSTGSTGFGTGGTLQINEDRGTQSITIIDERLSVDARLRSFSMMLSGGLAYANGDRTGFFASTPEFRSSVEVRMGSTLFESTSALYASLELSHTSARRDFANGELPAYDVLNLKIDGRLLDARMYLVWFNLLNENYATQNGYPMTPQTFVYGIVWTLFE